MTASATVDTRDRASDFLKAAAIVGVVCIHAHVPLSSAFRFCVPVFVAIWAFHIEIGLSRRHAVEQWSYLRSRFLRLLAPYVFWTGLYLALFHDPKDWRTTPVREIVEGWFSGYGWAGQYFFIILFQLVWLMPLLRRAVRPDTLWPIVIVGSVWNVVSCYAFPGQSVVSRVGDRLFVYWIPYAALGIAFARGYPRRLPIMLVLAVALLLAVPLEYVRLYQWRPKASPYLAASVTVGTLALLMALGPRHPQEAQALEPRAAGRTVRVFTYLGRNTMAIFVCNWLVLNLAAETGLSVPSSAFAGTIVKVGLVVLAIGTSLLVGRLFRQVGLGLLVGGRAA